MTDRTRRPLKRRAVLHLSGNQLAILLNLPDDIDVAAFKDEPERDGMAVLLEGERFEEVPEGRCPPDLLADVFADQSDDGTVTRRTVWAEAGVEVAEWCRPDAFNRIHRVAVELQANLDADPDLQADGAVAGEIEGLWSALRLIDERRWKVLHDAARVWKASAENDS